MIKNKFIFLLGLTITLHFSLFAQDKEEIEGENKVKDGKVSESFDIISSIKPKIGDATKIEVIPEKENLTPPKKYKPEYQAESFYFPVKSETFSIKPIQQDKTTTEKLNRAYLKGGYGNLNTIFFNGTVNSLRNKDYLFSTKANYYSGVGNIKNSEFMNVDLDLMGKKNFAKHILTGGVGYNLNQIKQYGAQEFRGVDRLDPMPIIIPAITYNDIHLSVGFDKIPLDSHKLQYQTLLNYYNYFDGRNQSENFIQAKATLIESFKSNYLVFDLGMDNIFYNYTEGTKSKNLSRSVLRIDAKYQFDWNGLKGYAGLKTASDNDTLSAFHIYPNIYVDYPLSDNLVIPFIKTTGGLQTNTLKSITTENPFVVVNPSFKNQNQKILVEGGVKGKYENTLSYLTSLSIQSVSNMMFYLNDSAQVHQFRTYYTDKNINIFNFHAEISYFPIQQLEVKPMFDYFGYNLKDNKTISQAYHRPNLITSLIANYSIDGKISTGLEVRYVGKRYGKIIEPNQNIGNVNLYKNRELDGYVDLNAFALYNFNKQFGVSLELKNIVNKNYEIWNYYEARGIQVLFGLKYKL